MPLLGAPYTRAHSPDLYERGLRKVIFDEWDRHDEQYKVFYNISTADKRQIHDAFMAGLGLVPEKAEGAPITYDAMQQAWKKTYTIRTFARGIKVTKEAMEDDLYAFAARGAQELGRASKYTKNAEAISPLNNLTDTVYTAGGTNYTLLSTTHFRADGGTWSNRPTNPVDLSIESLEAALEQFRSGMLDQRGQKYDIMPKYLAVGTSDEFVAHRLVQSQQRPFSNNNDINTIRTTRDLEVLVLDHMNNDSRWFLIAKKEDNGFNYFDKLPFTVERADEPDTGNLLISGRWRSDWGLSHTTGVWGTPP